MFQSWFRGRLAVGLMAGLVALVAIPSTARAEDLAVDLSRLMALGDIPGLSVAVIRGDSMIWSGALGVRDRQAGGPVDHDTVFEAASLSKTLFAYVVLRLADRGLIDLDAPLVGYAPYPRLAGDPRHRRVTARMCLSHTSGLPNWGTRFLAEPGSRFTYSGEGIRFLRKTAEAITGLTLEELARQEVFDPLGMAHSSYLWQDGFETNHASGHDSRGRPQSRRLCPDGSAAASLHTTARDYARFLQACLVGEGLSADMAANMMQMQTRIDLAASPEVREHLGWSLGWGLMDGDQGPVIWQWGDNGDTVAMAIGCPERRCGLVYFANSATGMSVAHEVVAGLFPDRLWCLDALGYQRYDSPERVQWVESAAQRALQRGQLAPAESHLETLLQLRPDHPWAEVRLHEVRLRQAAVTRPAAGRS